MKTHERRFSSREAAFFLGEAVNLFAQGDFGRLLLRKGAFPAVFFAEQKTTINNFRASEQELTISEDARMHPYSELY